MTWLRKPLPAALLLVLIWTACRLVALHHTGIPLPNIHDEFSYLLGADTFAHGRLANPSPAMAPFFESPHILVRPIYVSKYPPGQAMFLALGQCLFGAPFYGVLIGNALMLFCFCFMLCAWVETRWAIAVTAALAVYLRPGMYWTESYWGGSVAAAGGALVLLGIGLYRKKPTAVSGILFALGGLLLFWTRPFEGGVFTLAVLAVFAIELWRKRSAQAVLAAVIVFAIGGAWTGYYNRSITGSPLKLPYMLHDHEYNAVPVFAFLPLRPDPVYTTPRLAAQHSQHGEEASHYHPELSRTQVLKDGFFWTLEMLARPLGRAVLLSLLIVVAWRDPVYRKMAIVAVVVIAALSVETFHIMHYAAPVWPALAVMLGLWAERAWKLRLGQAPAGAVLVVIALIVVAGVLPSRTPLHHSTPGNEQTATGPNAWNQRRAALIQRLSQLDRPQLVIVRYPAPAWHLDQEWVYNSAEIDRQPVIFAHDLGADRDRALLAYYPNRTPWLVTFDPATGQEQLAPYQP